MIYKTPLSAKAKRRVLMLARELEKLPPNTFDFGAFFMTRETWNVPPRGTVVTPSVMKECDTAACAMGHAATLKPFKRIGLSAKFSVNADVDFQIDGKTVYTSKVAKEIFDLDQQQAKDLFWPRELVMDRIKTPKQWARYARRYVRDHS